MTALKELLARVEAATGPHREIDEAIAQHLEGWTFQKFRGDQKPYWREAHDSLDDFPSPPWSVRALCEHVLPTRTLKALTCWEPACNRGYMAKPLAEYFGEVITSDTHNYGWTGHHLVRDFLIPHSDDPKADWVITNPPFRLAAQFTLRALSVADMVAMLVRTSFLEGQERHETLFKPYPPAIVAQFVERVPMVKGRHDPEASTATSYG